MKTSKEIIIIGGGIIGLAIAVELKLRGVSVTVLSRKFTEGATQAAAGMLAPRAEQLPQGVMLDLALQSLSLYPEWIAKLTQISGEDPDFNPGGIIAPVYQLPPQGKNHQQDSHRIWLEQNTIQVYQPHLSEEVVGGWWYPEEGQVDPRRLAKVLLGVAQSLGVDVKEGVEAIALSRQNGKIKNVLTKSGIFEGDIYILAGGAWSGKLLPLPIRPVKGQMLSLNISEQHPLERVIFGENTYLVPKQDGRLIVGATSEDLGWVSGNTAEGINSLLQRAIKLYPPLASWEMKEIWYGYRPATPDEMPILGYGDSSNLILATGHYRNGILLAPITAKLISDLITASNHDSCLIPFSYQRFTQINQKQDLTLVNFNPKPEKVTAFNCPKESASTKQIMNYPTPLSNGNSNSKLNLNDSLDVTNPDEDSLIIAGRKFHSRLLTGTGKYPTIEAMQKSVIYSGCEIVTVAVRRVQSNAPGHEGLAEALDWSKIWMLPNTAGCQTAEEAIRVARLGREMAKLLGQEDNNFVKLEVIPDPKYLLPDPLGTLQAAEQLVREGFAVLPYINADPLLCKRLEEVGCATVMPLGSPIGSGQGIKNEANIKIIIEQSQVPVVIDAGIGLPSEAAYGMELGADALLINSAIALAENPAQMAKAMKLAVEAGRIAYQAGRMPIKSYADASSPLTGVVQ
jgi:thiazole synthase